MKALVTGSSGFYGTHLCRELEVNDYQVIRCDIKKGKDTIIADITDVEMIKNLLVECKPDILINLAGQANVGLSWKKPQLTFQLNTIGLVNILEAVKTINSKIRVIAVGSSDEYGKLLDRGTNVTEDIPVNPMTPYAISKLAQEQFASLYYKNFGLDICMIRQFNLGGAGQAKGYIIPDFASGIVEIENGRSQYLSVGNLDSARDFTHVKDACRAVRLIAEKGHSGEIYNICSGVTHTAREILDKLVARSVANIEIRQDSSKMRPSDTPVIRGNHSKLTDHTGWEPAFDLDDILNDVLEYQRKCFNNMI